MILTHEELTRIEGLTMTYEHLPWEEVKKLIAHARATVHKPVALPVKIRFNTEEKLVDQPTITYLDVFRWRCNREPREGEVLSVTWIIPDGVPCILNKKNSGSLWPGPGSPTVHLVPGMHINAYFTGNA